MSDLIGEEGGEVEIGEDILFTVRWQKVKIYTITRTAFSYCVQGVVKGLNLGNSAAKKKYRDADS